MKKTLWTLLRVAFGIALLGWVLGRAATWGAARQMLSTVWLLPLLALQTLCGTAFEAQRLRVLYRSQSIDIPFGYAYRLCAVAAFFGLCIPGGTGGDVMKLYYLNSRARGKGVEVATVLLIDRMVGMFALLLVLVGVALAETVLIRQHAAIAVLILGASALIVAMPAFAAAMCSRYVRAGRWYRRSRHFARVSDAFYAFREHKGALVSGIAVSLCGHFALGSMFVAAGRAAIPAAPPLAVCMLSFLGMFANALPITPGGLGVGESAFQALFTLAGYTGGAALMIAWRIGMLFPSVLGSVFYMRGLRHRPAGEPAAWTECAAAAAESAGR